MSTILSTLGICLILISTIYCRTFGYNNSLTCNCNYETSCQDSGMCSTGGCRQGWSGPTCQKENVALGKPANQSSYYKVERPSSHGVDGDKSTFIDMMRSKQGWWLVDLQHNYPIRDITLYHRPGHLYRLRGFSVYIIDEDLVSTLCYHHTNEPLTLIYNIRCNSTGRYINITSAINPEYPRDTNPDGILNLSEVEIYVCSTGTYGTNCEEICHCSHYTRCDDITGYCKDVCLVGWNGNSCNQSCSDTNSYGDGCKFDCDDRKCNGTSDCDHVTGACLYGCQDGWDSQDCTRGIVRNGEPDASSSLNPIVIGVIGAVFGVAVTLAVVIIIYCIYFKSRRKGMEVVPDNVLYVNVDVDTETIKNDNSNTREPVIISEATVSENQTVQPPNEYETLDQRSVHSPTYTSLQ